MIFPSSFGGWALMFRFAGIGFTVPLSPLLFFVFLFAVQARAEVPVDPQIEALINTMTPEEKAGQLTILADEFRNTPPGINPEFKRRQINELLADVRAGRVGALLAA